MRASRHVVVLAFALALPAVGSLGGCQSGHEVRILLGPDDETLSTGFLCTDATGRELIRDTSIGGNPPVLQFGVVVDIIGFGSRIPGCRGEELITACERGDCRVLHRACHVVSLELASPDALLDELHAQLANFNVIDNAPNEPVLIRITTVDLPNPLSIETETCPPMFEDPGTDIMNVAVGCAYSCPVELDNIDEVSVSLDTLTRQCEAAVRTCAGFLR